MTKDQIILNGKKVKKEDALQLAKRSIPEWEKAIYSFLSDWWNEDDFILVKTSGSTGIPKTIEVPKKPMRESAKMTGEYFGFEENQSVLLCLPAQFIAGKMMLVRAIEWGLWVDTIEPKLELSIPSKPYFFSAMTPPQIEASLRSVNGIQKILLGGAPVSETLETQLKSIQPLFYISYGMTETVSHIAIRNIQTDPTNTYTGLKNISFSLYLENQLVIKAPKLLEHPLTTTDCVELVNEKTFRWKGRADFVINSGGLKISPEEIEEQISSTLHHAFFIHGKPDAKWGQIPILIIESPSFDTQKLLTQIQSLTAKNKAPKEIYFLDKFIHTQNGKLNRLATFDSLKL